MQESSKLLIATIIGQMHQIQVPVTKNRTSKTHTHQRPTAEKDQNKGVSLQLNSSRADISTQRLLPQLCHSADSSYSLHLTYMSFLNIQNISLKVCLNVLYHVTKNAVMITRVMAYFI